MVSVELAAGVPALLVVLVLAVSTVRLGIDEVRCVDAARLAARALARGESEGAARALAIRAGPPGLSLMMSAAGPEVVVKVLASRELAGLAWTVAGSATAQREDFGSEIVGHGGP
jgi:Flp pilus assembly protein TadG